MLYRRHNRGFNRTSIKILCLIISFSMMIVFAVKAFEDKASQFSRDYIVNFAGQITTDALSDAVKNTLNDLDFDYNDFAMVQYGSDGKVKSVETNSKNINIFKASVTKSAQDEVAKIKRSEMKIPLGAFTGLTLLSNAGPEIPLTFCLTGNFDSRIESNFESAGINQTIHHIKLVITSHIVTGSVDHQGEMTFDTDFELAQSVIVGEIPTTYGGNHLLY